MITVIMMVVMFFMMAAIAHIHLHKKNNSFYKSLCSCDYMYVNIRGGRSYRDLIRKGLLEIGEGAAIDKNVWVCHDAKDCYKKVKIGKNCRIRSGTVIYSGCEIGDNCNFGHHVVLRENCVLGSYSSLGTHVTVENNTTIGHHSSIETGSHVTGNAHIGNYVFFGAMVITNNDFSMNYKRKGHGTNLVGPVVGDNVRVGSGAMLMAGVKIGDNSIINAGEIVRKDVPENSLMFTLKEKPIYKKIVPEEIVE